MMQTVWNRINTALLVLVLLVLAGALVKGVYGGPMDPPAGPGPTLPQVEPRIPISQPAPGGFPIVISQPGSYFLTQNITGEAGKDGIQITTGAVTLDLNGFTVGGVPGSLKGVHVTCSAVCYVIQIRGGNVTVWGGDGIDMGLANSSQITSVQILGNAGNGVTVQESYDTVSDCTVGGNGGEGVDAGSYPVFVRDSHIGSNGANGIVAGPSTIEGNSVGSNAANGMSVSGGGLVRNNTVTSNVANGISVSGSPGALVSNNTVTGNGGSGIVGSGGPLVQDNISSGNGGDGVSLSGTHGAIIDNFVTSNTARGIAMSATFGVVMKNFAGLNSGGNYNIVAGNEVGPMGSADTSTSPWANLQ